MNPVLAELTKSDKFNEYLERIKKSNDPISILGLAGVGAPQIVASTEENIKRPVCLITYNELQAKKLAEEIRSYINGVFFFPKREILTYDYVAESKELPYERIEVLKNIKNGKIKVLVCSIEALLQPIISEDILFKNKISVKVGETYDLEELKRKISMLGYTKTEMIDGKGEFSSRGGILDLSFFNIVPNLVIMAPKNFKELEDMLEFAIDYNGPIYIRYPRGGEESTKIDKEEKIELGKAEKLSEGNDYTIVAIGKMVQRAYEISSILKKEGIGVGVINARFLKPFDEENIISWIGNSKVITIEDNIIKGGLGSTVLEALKKYHKTNELKMLGYPDEFIKQGTVDEIEKDYKLDVESILDMIRKWSNYE